MRRNQARAGLSPLFSSGKVTSFHQRWKKSVNADQTRRGSDSLIQGMRDISRKPRANKTTIPRGIDVE
jgi:hypothetical protein